MKAFPTTTDNGHAENQDGMDLRDYFAAKAMQGIFDSKIIMEICQMTTDGDLPELVATMAYSIADAMMEARDR